jgi:hypothetical protein
MNAERVLYAGFVCTPSTISSSESGGSDGDNGDALDDEVELQNVCCDGDGENVDPVKLEDVSDCDDEVDGFGLGDVDG